MRIEYVNPFVTATFSVVRTLFDIRPEKGRLSARPMVFTSKECSIITGVTGMIHGQAMYGFSGDDADRVAGRMVGNKIVEFDALAVSALAELGNMITGNAMALLSEAGYVCDIAPPSIVRGTNVKISTTNIPALVMPISLCDLGEMELTISLAERSY